MSKKRIRLRPEVRAFAVAMEEKLRKHDRSRGRFLGGGNGVRWLLDRMYQEARELSFEVATWEQTPGVPGDAERILNEAADVANFAMMIAETCRSVPSDE